MTPPAAKAEPVHDAAIDDCAAVHFTPPGALSSRLVRRTERPDPGGRGLDPHWADDRTERRLDARSPWTVSITYCDGSRAPAQDAVGRFVGRASAVSLCDVCFLWVRAWRLRR